MNGFVRAASAALLLFGLLVCASAQTPTPTPTPVCVVNPKSPANPAVKPGRYKGKLYRFCCESCRYQFSKKPWKWAK